jgi:hypothetical protein
MKVDPALAVGILILGTAGVTVDDLVSAIDEQA